MLLLCPTFSYALGGFETLHGDDKRVAEFIKKELQISSNDAYELYIDYIKSLLNTTKWHYTFYNNSSLKLSKIGNSKNRFLFINITTDNRFVNISTIKYKNEGQVIVQVIETLPRDSTVVVDKFNDLKKKKDYLISTENSSFASFEKKGFTSLVKTLAYSGVGAVQYVELYVYNLKK